MAISRTNPMIRLANTDAIMINDATPIFLNMEGAAVFMGEDVPHPKGKEKGRLLSLNLD
jgi:hypothetical protein